MEKLYFIDDHIHGSFGINFNFATYDEVRFVLKELFKKNIRGICPTLVGDTEKEATILRQLEIFKKIQDEQKENIKDECYLIGAHLEGTFLNPNVVGIQNSETCCPLLIDSFKALTGDFSDIVKIITLAPEMDNLESECHFVDWLNKNNIITQAGHTKGTSIGNCRGTTHHFNAMAEHIHHRNPSIALEGLIRDDVYIEIIADLVHLSEDILKLIHKVKPLDKILLISDSLPSSNYDGDIIFCGKKINKEGKDSKGTLAGSNKTIDAIAYNLIEKNIFAKEEIKQIAFYNQIKYLNLTDREIDILKR